mmetsp:Transcript_29282/g.93855  ORF Transcript_29282/g.93855 Transcript_29282/m.93855 type:complete len:209 (-) Transcript_29282:186-812(-)
MAVDASCLRLLVGPHHQVTLAPYPPRPKARRSLGLGRRRRASTSSCAFGMRLGFPGVATRVKVGRPLEMSSTRLSLPIRSVVCIPRVRRRAHGRNVGSPNRSHARNAETMAALRFEGMHRSAVLDRSPHAKPESRFAPSASLLRRRAALLPALGVEEVAVLALPRVGLRADVHVRPRDVLLLVVRRGVHDFHAGHVHRDGAREGEAVL